MVNKVCQAMTDEMLKRLERGDIPPWAREWKSGGVNGPVRNAFSNTPYQGINVLNLNMAMIDSGYSDPRFATWKQIQEKGGRVSTGEEKRFHYINFWKTFDQKDKQGRLVKDSNGKQKKIPFLQVYRVYNVEQTEGLNLGGFKDENAAPFAPIETAREIWEAWNDKPELRHGGDLAAYYSNRDLITMPKPEAFNKPEAYYATLFHEMGHATGHDKRLARPGIANPSRFGTATYAREELVAEMYAAMMCGISCIAPVTIDNHVAYCKSWADRLREDGNLLIVAAGAAQKAVDYTFATSGVAELVEA